ncbi:MAG: LysE family translocator [Beijerinckiaceae bacterium]|nr:LysE family translocator [Beijerinckiaceae bacterium]MCZ8299304.1 LysE family translocator [Beijerinckiaceae bacterium]
MTLSTFLLFVPVYALAAASPGPAVAAIVARTLAMGSRGALAFTMGLVAGDLVWFSAATLGLGLLAQTYQPLFTAVKYAGALYLIYVAISIWRMPARPLTEAEPAAAGKSGFRAFLGAFLLTLGNPKTMVFFLSIMPLVVSPEQITLVTALEIAAIIVVVLTAIFMGYVVLAARARRLLRSTEAIRRINRTTAGIMAGTAVVVAAR